ncbi:hypothetical protein MMC11_005780 [Xylographa trunciseda]|nr:hypothetical protein [Xylographa trunciseda]
MVTFTVDKDRKVSIGLFEAVMMPGGRTLRRSKRKISGNSVHAPSHETLPPAVAAPPVAATPPAAEPPAAVAEAGPAIETVPGWTAEDDQQLLELRKIGAALAGKQGIKERYKQLIKDDTANANDTGEGGEEGATTAETATEWTAEDDEQMVKLKKENKSWKDIEAALGGKKGAKARYKEVHKDAATAGDETGDEEEAKGKGTPMSSSLVLTDEELERRPSFAGQTIKPVVRLEDGIELENEEACFQEFFEAQKWVNVASKFFDKTGKKIDATELRAKLSSLWTEPLPLR